MTTITSTSPATPVNPCPQNWTYFAPSSACFYSPLTDFNWTDAEEFCVNRSSHLVSIHSEEELYFFINTFLWGWSGLHKTDGEWKWTDNTPTDYLYWQRGYPQENENSCVHLFGTFWNDHACGDSLPTVCKMVIQ
uniref:C-type lectin domain-containing protein n=1 Tax=Panagrolaimus superbus TaxID=310955 RepID=A0A914YPA2_9BILA